MDLKNIQPEHILSFLIFFIGTLGLVVLNAWYANIFKVGAEKDAAVSVKEAGITFVSGHFLAFFVLPFAIVVGASLAILGKLDSGVSAIIGVVISYIVQKVNIR
ncbi:MAG: hypothetical protein M1352_01570 [Patescibacteria group bacterium]|nr:hypothetical protein [Patescibacteria group bacterium]